MTRTHSCEDCGFTTILHCGKYTTQACCPDCGKTTWFLMDYPKEPTVPMQHTEFSDGLDSSSSKPDSDTIPF